MLRAQSPVINIGESIFIIRIIGVVNKYLRLLRSAVLELTACFQSCAPAEVLTPVNKWSHPSVQDKSLAEDKRTF